MPAPLDVPGDLHAFVAEEGDLRGAADAAHRSRRHRRSRRTAVASSQADPGCRSRRSSRSRRRRSGNRSAPLASTVGTCTDAAPMHRRAGGPTRAPVAAGPPCTAAVAGRVNAAAHHASAADGRNDAGTGTADTGARFHQSSSGRQVVSQPSLTAGVATAVVNNNPTSVRSTRMVSPLVLVSR